MSEPKVLELMARGDAVLVARAQAGDDQAFRQLFDRHTARVVRVLSRILGSDPDVADLSHEVFLLAYQRLAIIVDSQRFGAFLTGLCVNVARNHLRSRRRRRWLVFGSTTESDEPAAAEPSDGREAMAATYSILATMPEHLRICFALRFIDGHELTEVAQACDVSLATAKRWLQKAEAHFVRSARAHAVLADWVHEGARWGVAK